MKKSALLLLFACILSYSVYAQPCLPNGIIFTTQSQIDNFTTDHPNCTEIGGDVKIMGSGITNLNGLSVITYIGGELEILETSLVYLIGLDNLEYVGALFIGDQNQYGNPLLVNLANLSNLDSIGGPIYIRSNNNLQSITGLENIEHLPSHIEISWNPSLTSLSGLQNLQSTGWWINISGQAFTSLNGLNRLKTVGGSFYIGYCPGLTSLDGLDSLTTVTLGFQISYNDNLLSFAGIENLTYVGDYFKVHNNSLLTTLADINNSIFISKEIEFYNNGHLVTLPTFSSLSTAYSLEIVNNNSLVDLSGLEGIQHLNNQLLIENNYLLDNLTGLNNLNYISNDMIIRDNPNLTSLKALKNLTDLSNQDYTIENNDRLKSLLGTENISYQTVKLLRLVDNDSLCECDLKNICKYLDYNKPANIWSNASGCDSKIEIQQKCDSGCFYQGKIFPNQDSIDAFPSTYPKCTEIWGDVTISGADITNLDSLTVLKGIWGTLNINNNPALSNCNGLQNIDFIGNDLIIENNDILANLTGFNNLPSVEGSLNISDNNGLMELNGLDNLTNISMNFNLENNTVLLNLTDLNNLKNIGGDLSISGNNTLSSCQGLGALNSISGDLSITNNSLLSDLYGLENVDAYSIMNLNIYDNPSLSICDVTSICNYLANPNGVIDIHNNDNGCNSQAEVNALCTVSTYDLTLNNGIAIYPNPASSTLHILNLKESPIQRITIYNISGQISIDIKVPNNTIDISGLNTGIYFIDLKFNDINIKRKLIIQ